MTDDDLHWQEVMDLAEKYGLIAHSYGGIAVLATHAEQKEHGIFNQIQYKCHGGPFPVEEKP